MDLTASETFSRALEAYRRAGDANGEGGAGSCASAAPAASAASATAKLSVLIIRIPDSVGR